MEEVLINIDSKYRDIIQYPNECKFRYNFMTPYKNIISARMVSLEVNNNINYIDSKKKNNFFKLYLPNKLNDPDGIGFQLVDGLLQSIQSIQNIINTLFNQIINTTGALQQPQINGINFAEKYFYVFYLNQNTTINFNFSLLIGPYGLAPLIIESGWHSVYGLVIQIQTYITFTRTSLIQANVQDNNLTNFITSCKFTLNEINLRVFDRRSRDVDMAMTTPGPDDCIRSDKIETTSLDNSNPQTNLDLLKDHIYATYIENYSTNGFVANIADTGILDKLLNEQSGSLYYINNTPTTPNSQSTQLYNLVSTVNLTALRTSFSNKFTDDTTTINNPNTYYYYHTDLTNPADDSSWSYSTTQVTPTNKLVNLLSKEYLRTYSFITEDQNKSPTYVPSLVKDIAEFQIDFNTYTESELINPVSNGLVDIKKMQYPPLGFYLGFRPNLLEPVNKFLITPVISGTQVIMTATKTFNVIGNDYIFLKVNDWGYFDFFGQQVFAKILLTSALGNARLDDYINKEYRFRQPQNIQKLDIELVDYLGNTVDLNGTDYSFTLELKQILNTDQKNVIEKQNLIFMSK
jgi:hypothetical protein